MSTNQNSTEQQIYEVAQRIRSLRQDMGISSETMAAKTGLSIEEYKKMEKGESDFSFTFIHKCAGVFGVDIADLMEGDSPELTGYTVTRKGKGKPIARRTGLEYNSLAHKFKNKIVEPFHVVIPYSEEALSRPRCLSSHVGQEMDIVIKGTLRIIIGNHTETLYEGDCIYYDSSVPHDEVALGGEDCEIYALVMKPTDAKEFPEIKNVVKEFTHTNFDKAGIVHPVADKFVNCETDDMGQLTAVKFKNEESFNFAYDIVDAMAEKCPDKTAMIHVAEDKSEKIFTFKEIKEYSCQTANYFKSLGIKKGDKVMLVLKRHYQFWFSMVALHKIGAVAIPATNQLKEHDFEYRYTSAGVKAIVCTADGDTYQYAESAAKKCPEVEKLIMVGGSKEGWHDFDKEYSLFSGKYDRPEDCSCGDESALMFFTSGTTGNPKMASHKHTYALGHYVTAKYWHCCERDGLHLTISDTGWGKSLWGKLYGQWLCEGAVFVYDFDKFDENDLLPMFARYNITTFCAPPTMLRMLIRGDLSKYDLSSIHHMTTAGEALNPEVFNKFKEATGLEIMEGFGQTETTLAIANLYGTTPKIGAMGKANPQYDVDVVDSDGNSVPAGEVGEIVIHTDKKVPCGLFREYYRDSEKTNEAWHDGLYHTGDTAWRDEDGYFWYVGRVDDVIKSSGYRIGPFEIESVIMELPYVLECGVSAVPDEVRGQVVKASIVLTKGTTPSEELKKEIQKYVKDHTAPYKYPRVVVFRDELPKTISGKIQRNKL